MEKRKLIYDCDPGTDDSVSIIMAIMEPTVDLLAITCESGNFKASVSANHALKVLEYIGHPEIPVYKGTEHPLTREYPSDPYCHGQDGLGNHFFPEPKIEAQKTHAAIAIVDLVNKYPGEITLVCSAPLTNLAMALLEELQAKWLTVPGARGIHHAYLAGTLIHSYSVACIAKSIAEHTPGANVDLCTVGGMLHDIGKLYTYKLDGVSVDMTDEGMLYDHLFIGAEFVGNYAEQYNISHRDELKLALLRHIILSHHGKLEYGAVSVPLSIEAHIVYHADAIDAAAEQVREYSSKVGNVMWTDRIWALENKPHLTTQYVDKVMESPSVEENSAATA